jgi:hypothetical protein
MVPRVFVGELFKVLLWGFQDLYLADSDFLFTMYMHMSNIRQLTNHCGISSWCWLANMRPEVINASMTCLSFLRFEVMCVKTVEIWNDLDWNSSIFITSNPAWDAKDTMHERIHVCVKRVLFTENVNFKSLKNCTPVWYKNPWRNHHYKVHHDLQKKRFYTILLGILAWTKWVSSVRHEYPFKDQFQNYEMHKDSYKQKNFLLRYKA